MKRILAVDDSPLVLRNLNMMLGEDYEVSFATSGQKALEILDKKDFDLIFLDYEMPGMSGFEVIQEIRKKPETKDIPVVFLTGVSDKESLMGLMEYSPSGFLIKPVKYDLLKETLTKVLGEN